MDKPTTPGGLSGSKSSWPEDQGSEQELGATGVFGAIKTPEQSTELGNSKPEPDMLANWFAEPAQPQPAPQPPPVAAVAPKPVAEPMVHKVVLGGGAAANQTQLLDRIRMASAERPPAAQSGGQGSGGFTELLRTLGNESPTPAAKEAPRPETPRSETSRPPADSGFTSLLQTLGTSQTPPAPVASPSPRPVQPVVGSTPSHPSPGGFTELLRAAPMPGSEIESRQVTASERTAPMPLVTNPVATGPKVTSPEVTSPGSITQLFGTLGNAEGTPSTEPPANRETQVPSAGSAGSFTRMLSLEQQSAPVAPPYREEPRPAAGGLDYSLPPAAPKPAQAGRDSFSPAQLPQTPSVPSTPPGSGVGITRLIQMLDEPSKPYSPPVESVPLSTPRAAEPGIWTQTFASLATPSEPAVQAAREPDWSLPPAVPTAPAYPVSHPPQYPPVANPPVMNQPPAAPAPSGPSEFTRILDASRMREMSREVAMRGGTGAEAFSPPPPPQSPAPAPQFAAPAPPPMPSYPIAPPAPPPMQGLGAMPQPGGFPPPQPPAYPMQYGQQAGGMPPMGAGLPQQPGMYVPAAPPMPAAPQLPPVKPPELGAQKLQMYLLIMGGVIIVLLIIILVTVIFLMKH